MQVFLSAIGAHPHLALLVVALVAFAESVAIVGTLVPAAIVMFTAGTLVGAGSLDLWPTLAAAALGAVLGDGLSYELGRGYEVRIREWPIFQRRKGAVARGEAFVRRHGGKSIALARFTGPVRAFAPLLVGFAHMPRARFYTINIASALLWAPAHILPGVLFGTSLQVAEAVSGRLAVIALLLLSLVWFAAWLVSAGIRFGVPLAQKLRDAAVARARGRDTRSARLMLVLLDPNRPGSQALLVGAVLLLGAGWLFLGVLQDVLAHDPLVQADRSVFHFLQGLRIDSVDRLLVSITEMGSVGVMLPLVIAVALWLAWRRCRRTAAYWLGVTAFGEALVLLFKFTLGRQRPQDIYIGMERFSFPSGHTALSTVVLGFLAFLLSRRQTFRVRLAIAAFASAYVALVAFSRLYLGVHWLSDVLGGVSLGVAWVSLAAMVYTQRKVDEDFAPRGLGMVAAMSILIFGGLWIDWRAGADLQGYTFTSQPRVMTAAEWVDRGWQRLPARRLEVAGEPEEPFELQWACSEEGIGRGLRLAGWRRAPAWSFSTGLRWLAPHTPLLELPVLPRFNQGDSSRAVFIRGPVERPGAREVLRLWRSDFDLATGERSRLPIWYGAVYLEERRHGRFLQSLVKRSLVPADSFERMLPGDTQRQIRTRAPGRPKTLLVRCGS